MARILTVTNWYPPHHRGGYELNCADVTSGMVARGHQAEVLCSNDRLPGAREEPEPLPVRRVLQLYWRGELPWRPTLSTQMKLEKANQAFLEEALDEVRPDVVSVWHMAAMSLNLLTTIARRGIPVVYAICDSWPTYALTFDVWSRKFNPGPARRRLGHIVERSTGLPAVLPELGAIGHGCFVSSFTRDDVERNSPWTFSNSEIIPSGIDRSTLRSRHDAGERPWGWQVAYFGRFDARKGTDTLLRAMAMLPPNASLKMYGRGGETERARLLHLAEELGVSDRVAFATLDRMELADAYLAADVVVFPSEWPEPFGLVPLESMECGTPVVATGVGGSADFLDDGENCVLFHPGDAQALAMAVRRLAQDPALRRRITTAGRETARRYDVERMVDAYESAFLRAIDAT